MLAACAAWAAWAAEALEGPEALEAEALEAPEALAEAEGLQVEASKRCCLAAKSSNKEIETNKKREIINQTEDQN